jgi:hypothetical protein
MKVGSGRVVVVIRLVSCHFVYQYIGHGHRRYWLSDFHAGLNERTGVFHSSEVLGSFLMFVKKEEAKRKRTLGPPSSTLPWWETSHSSRERVIFTHVHNSSLEVPTRLRTGRGQSIDCRGVDQRELIYRQAFWRRPAKTGNHRTARRGDMSVTHDRCKAWE